MNVLGILNDDINTFDFDVENKGFFLILEVNHLLDNKQKLFDYFREKDYCVETLDDFIDMLVLFKYKDFGVFSDYLNPEFKDDYNNIVTFCKNTFDKYSPSEIIRFVNKNIDILLFKKSASMLRRITLLITPYFNGCKETYKRMLNECIYIFFPLNDRLKKYILDNKDMVHIILDKKQYNIFKYSNCSEYFEFIKDCIERKINVDDVEKIVNEIYTFGTELFKKCSNENVLEFLSIIQSIDKFFREIKSPKAFELDKKIKMLDALKDQYIVKNGVHHKKRIPIEEFEQFFKNESIAWDVRFLSITHQRIAKDKWESYYVNTIKNERESAFDVLTGSMNHCDKFFTLDRQIDINAKNQIFDLILSRVYINEENIDNFIMQFSTMITSVYKHFQVDYDADKLDANLKTMKELFINLIHNVENLELLCGLNYGLSMFICGMIEEFLANLFKQLNINDRYIDDNHLTLPVLLGDENIKKLFDEDDIMILKYLLLGNNGVGFGYRNKLAHFKSLNLEEINDALVLNILHIFIYIVNCCFVKIVHSVRKKGEWENE